MESLRVMQRQLLQHLNHARTHLPQWRQRSVYSKSYLQSSAMRQSTQTRTLHIPRRTALTSRFFSQAARRPFQIPKHHARRFATEAPTSQQNLSLSERMRKLSREYGWSALGVYLALSAADFPFCFLAVKMLGTDRIGHWEHVALTWIKDTFRLPFSVTGTENKIDGAIQEVQGVVEARVPLDEVRPGTQTKRVLEEGETYVVQDHGYKQAEAANTGANASLWTQLALAYAIHKSFIFIRVPLTAAVTPKVVKTLRSWGWNIGKRPAKPLGPRSSSGTGVNTKGSGVKSD